MFIWIHCITLHMFSSQTHAILKNADSFQRCISLFSTCADVCILTWSNAIIQTSGVFFSTQRTSSLSRIVLN
uniref:Uncharacterized protein n=1 Tax=Anguilla anguilla TaxID=7936 RepID=A0A0E9XG99_ANGAN